MRDLGYALMALMVFWAVTANCELDIDYSHTVVGSGTILTDYRMGAKATSEASGAIRGTGDVVNKYFFSTNNSTLFTVEDQFQLSKKPTKNQVKTVRPGYPKWPGSTGNFRLTGTRWAGNLEVATPGGAAKKPAKDNSRDLAGGKFEFTGAGFRGTLPTVAATVISDPSELDVNAALAVGGPRSDQSFSYRSIWQDSRNVTIRSIVGQPHEVIYEDDAWIAGNSTGRKNLKVY